MKTYKNGNTEIFACDSHDRVGIGVHALKCPDSVANYAMDLMKAIAATAMLDTNPSAAMKTPKQIAEAACDVAAAAFEEFERRGWLIAVPDMTTLRDEARENRGRN